MKNKKLRLLKKLRRILPAEAVLGDEERLRPYECDALSAYRRLPMIAVLPDNVAQVRAVLQLCAREQTPVVARGAGTGLSGGALPRTDGVLLVMAKFNRILAVDEHNRTATVQPGVTNLAVSEAVAHLGLFYAPDPSSQLACTIGGNVAENSGGVHCLKYGLTVHNIMEVKVITMDGAALTFGGRALDAPGFDLAALITGSEGLLGVIVEVTVKLLPRPDAARVLLAAFDQVEKAGDGVAAVIGAGIIPAGLEMMDNPAIRATEEFAGAGYPVDAEAILLCEVDGMAEEVAAQMETVDALLRQAGAVHIRAARDEHERALFWSGRKGAFPAVGRISPDYYCIDGTIPRRELGRVLRRIKELSTEFNLRVANVFHAGDGNLHPLILYDANVPGELERTEKLAAAILGHCVEVGGTITGEHGVGVEKINQMCTQFNARELAQMHAVKWAFDPDGLLNPGKAVPTLARCAEFGAMHVHHGQVAFPELERF